MSNTGTSIEAWINIIPILIIMCFLINIIYQVYKFSKVHKSLNQQDILNTISTKFNIAISTIFLLTFVFGYYFAYGNGNDIELEPIDTYGSYKENLKFPESDSVEVLEMKRKNSIPKELQSQEENSDKYREEADEYVDKILKRVEKDKQ